ncbi:hypothetical protein C8R44DRAFT_985127 [Mycena epipterygia]|nr:hypothetical protein C8R44DRAFT_985127 [Mycena epipterygia]
MPCPGLPPELWHRIITIFLAPRRILGEPEDILLDSDTIRDLKSCSVVSQALLFPAQSVLFRSIDLLEWEGYELSYCYRFMAILEESPHLASHVQILAAPADAEIFTLISNMKLSRLRDIQIEGSGKGSDIAGPVLELVLSVIGQSIRHVQFLTFDRLSYSTVARIIAKAPNLDGLHFFECTPHDDPQPDLSDPPPSQRTKITQLSLESSPDIAKWLIHPAFPLDCTGLIYVDVHWAATAHVGLLLETARKTINCLEFMAGMASIPGLYPCYSNDGHIQVIHSTPK